MEVELRKTLKEIHDEASFIRSLRYHTERSCEEKLYFADLTAGKIMRMTTTALRLLESN